MTDERNSGTEDIDLATVDGSISILTAGFWRGGFGRLPLVDSATTIPITTTV